MIKNFFFLFVFFFGSTQAQWYQDSQITNRTWLYSFTNIGDIVFCLGADYSLYISNDNGGHWKKNISASQPYGFKAICTFKNVLYGNSFSTSDGLYQSLDTAKTWQLVKPTDWDKNFLSVSQAGIFIGGSGRSGFGTGIFYPTDSSWVRCTNGIPATVCVYTSLTKNQRFIIGTNSGIYYTDNKGLNWTQSNIKSSVTCSDTTNNQLFMAGEDGVYVSDDGAYWIITNEEDTSGNPMHNMSLAAQDSNLYLGAWYNVYHSSDLGKTWSVMTDGIPENMFLGPDFALISMYMGKDTLLAGIYVLFSSWYEGLWKYPLKITTAIKPEQIIGPTKFKLDQNYPNPFNPTTTINFSIPKAEYVTLKIYDALGKEVATLVDEELAAGNYDRHFDASSLSSGVYFYTVKAGNFITSKKMLLLK